MVRIRINGNPLQARHDATILEASRDDRYAPKQFDIRIPSLHYLKNIQQTDLSGLSVVEVKGMDGLVNASTVRVVEGMEIQTKTPDVVEAQKTALERILAIHDLDCKNCQRTGNCELQQLQWQFRMTKEPQHAKIKTDPVDESGIIVRDNNKCVRCGRCVAACTNIQGIGAIKMESEGLTGKVVPSKGASLNDTNCVNCGQCVVVCPVGALRERDDTDKILEALANP